MNTLYESIQIPLQVFLDRFLFIFVLLHMANVSMYVISGSRYNCEEVDWIMELCYTT